MIAMDTIVITSPQLQVVEVPVLVVVISVDLATHSKDLVDSGEDLAVLARAMMPKMIIEKKKKVMMVLVVLQENSHWLALELPLRTLEKQHQHLLLARPFLELASDHKQEMKAKHHLAIQMPQKETVDQDLRLLSQDCLITYSETI